MTENDQQLVKTTIEEMLNFKTSLPTGNKALNNHSQVLLLDVFNTLMENSRSDTKGKSFWVKLLEKSAYHFLSDKTCPTELSFARSNFDLKVQRKRGSALNGLVFTSGSDYIRYPINMFATTGQTPCTDVHFIDMKNAHLFASRRTVLSNKVCLGILL